RFTIFHEFAHTLFPDYCDFLPQHQGLEQDYSEQHKKFENLCDAAAAEMLLPESEFRADIGSFRWLGFEAIHKLRSLYQASIDATVLRLVDLVPAIPCGAVFLTDQKGSWGGR